jgi:hypothetical protein
VLPFCNVVLTVVTAQLLGCRRRRRRRRRDFVNFLFPECARKGLAFPPVCARWVDVRKAFAAHHRTRSLNVKRMLAHAGMTFQGRLHSVRRHRCPALLGSAEGSRGPLSVCLSVCPQGIDDTRNIARIASHLLRQPGCYLDANADIASTSAHLPWLSASHSRTATAAPSSSIPSPPPPPEQQLHPPAIITVATEPWQTSSTCALSDQDPP